MFSLNLKQRGKGGTGQSRIIAAIIHLMKVVGLEGSVCVTAASSLAADIIGESIVLVALDLSVRGLEPPELQ
ncbi:hypothetical protein BDZ91DRAFT_717008 [Kalaharituber pfeilii]|nr:hypothetical protein BDZ91DRAFT_717008 [Kalaharituber pfeilii]